MNLYIEIGLLALAITLIVLAVILIYLEYKDEDRNQNVLVGVVGVLVIALVLIVTGVVMNAAALKKQKLVESDTIELQVIQKKNNTLEDKLKEAVPIEEVATLYQAHYPETEVGMQNYRDLLNSAFHIAAEYQSKQNDWAYNLAQLEVRLNALPRQLINTQTGDVADVDYTADLARIQRVLMFLGYYKGVIDGDQTSTFTALKKYQEYVNGEFNRQFPQSDTLWTPPSNYGLFGRGTLTKLQAHCKAMALKK